ncbi:hypothetical protein H105_03403 [Trichophyton soudanense CBS 452.61]|uniref:Uncharacterized protein n=1 Tax=Trichophyton soudanense CBS 452.61 TaxID=1215331 RepID=A0A022XXA7_TRISD|nr:hypothetical protein H105_03403 [Trichophyton soudanense CBS 452.61]EZG07453.1 hypothetical protein H106_03233 [Trichophyton rubrum CBS 735.88]
MCISKLENGLILLTKHISFPRLEGPYIETPSSTAGPSQQQVLDPWRESPLLVCKPLQGHLLERSSPLMPNVMTSDVTYLGTFRGDDIMAKSINMSRDMYLCRQIWGEEDYGIRAERRNRQKDIHNGGCGEAISSKRFRYMQWGPTYYTKHSRHYLHLTPESREQYVGIE